MGGYYRKGRGGVRIDTGMSSRRRAEWERGQRV